MENTGKLWENDEINFLIENYSIKGSKYCAEYLKRKQKAIIVKAKRLDLKSGKNSFKYSKEFIEPIVKTSKNIKEVLEKMGLRAAGGNYQVINKYIKQHDINIEHFVEFKKNSLIKLHNLTKQKLSDILTINSTFCRTHLKERLYSEGLKKRECEINNCGQGEEWNGKKMSLILDHKNGIHNDNRIENLRIVCPNCNATLDTHAGKNNKKKK